MRRRKMPRLRNKAGAERALTQQSTDHVLPFLKGFGDPPIAYLTAKVSSMTIKWGVFPFVPRWSWTGQFTIRQENSQPADCKLKCNLAKPITITFLIADVQTSYEA